MTLGRAIAISASMGTGAMGPAIQASLGTGVASSARSFAATTLLVATTASVVVWIVVAIALILVVVVIVVVVVAHHGQHHVLHLGHHGSLTRLEIRFAALKAIHNIREMIRRSGRCRGRRIGSLFVEKTLSHEICNGDNVGLMSRLLMIDVAGRR